MKIFLDDNRLCPVDFVPARTVEEFETIIQKNKENLEIISLDYDLSESGVKENLPESHIEMKKYSIMEVMKGYD